MKTDEAEVANKVKTIMCERGARASWIKQTPSSKIDGVNLPLHFGPTSGSPASCSALARLACSLRPSAHANAHNGCNKTRFKTQVSNAARRHRHVSEASWKSGRVLVKEGQSKGPLLG